MIRLTRRGFLAGAGAAGAAGVTAGLLAGCDDDTPAAAGDTVPFYGAHQAGIATPAQERLAFATFDVTASGVDALAAMLKTWTEAAARMCAGEPVGAVAGHPLAPPEDTGEADGLPPSNLTVTIGYGPSLFDGRFGLAGRRPAALADLPALPGDQLDPARCGGDICVQACADDAQVAFHAVRNLTRLGRGTVVLRWFQLGFGRTSTTSTSQDTPRNLMGFKDGTNNVLGEHTGDMSDFVWVGDDADQSWMAGGSFLVARRIRMLIESWDRDRLEDQENVIGRQKVSGAPLGAKAEHDPVPLGALRGDGQPVIPVDAHVRLAAPKSNGGRKLLRRGYSFTDGMDPATAQLDAGLFFICFQQDPSQFVTVQQNLGLNDALNEYIKHVGSAVFACPGGLSEGQRWDKQLLG